MTDEQEIPEDITTAGPISNPQATPANGHYQYSPVAVYACDTDGKFTFYNDAAVALWGKKPDKIKDRWWGASKIFRTNGQQILQNEWPDLFVIKEHTNNNGTEIRIERPDGLRKKVILYSDPIIDDAGTITGTVHTLTEVSQQANDAATDSQPTESTGKKASAWTNDDRYHKMIDEVEDYAILRLDEAGTIINWNKGVQKIKGYTAQEIIGKNFSVFYRENDRASRLPEQLLNEAKQNGRALHEGWRVRKDGTNFWGSVAITALHNEQNEVIGYTKVTRDLTERKSAEENLSVQASELFRKNLELLSQKEFVETILNSSLDLITVFDKELRFISLNKHAVEAYKRNDLIGKTLKDTFPEVVQTPMYDDLCMALKGNMIQNSFYKTTFFSESYENYYIPLTNNNQEVYGVLAISHDNSNLLEATEKIRTVNAALEKKNKELERINDSLEQFAYVSSHDLQEPLRKIQTFSDLILTRIHNTGFKPDEYLHKIKSSANRMSLLINDLLTFSRMNKDDELRGPVDLDKLMGQVINDFELLIQQKKAIIHRTGLPTIVAIPIQMNQLFYNMLSNALKFCDKRPEIYITAKNLDERAILSHLKLDPEKKYVHLNFKDNGIGFDQAFSDQVFTIFQRLNSTEKYSGTGIGLAICKKIVDNHGGHISVSSAPGKGASFDIYLPI
jgi:PAS domain S-box-containing protein